MLGHGCEGIAAADITGGSNVSDQDFFFDEDDKPVKAADKSGSKPAAKKGSGSSKAAPAPAPSADVQSVTLTVALLLAVIGILIGVVIGLFVGKSLATPDLTAATTPTTAASQAPQLTTEQLNSGQLPSGHPAVPGASTAATTGK
jgi:hypothetical protein